MRLSTEIGNWEYPTEFVKSAINQIRVVINRHIVTLSRKSEQAVFKDEYGNYMLRDWNNALSYFIDNTLITDELAYAYLSGKIEQFRFPPPGEVSELQIQRLNYTKNLVIDAIDQYRNTQLETKSHSLTDIERLDPVQYEHHCAKLLSSNGWDVRVTQASGDQGIDVIATYGNVKAVFQCKKYSQPVGNAAVQEIIAGKQFEQAHIAAVVSNASYTPSAKQLANATGIHLLHHDELPGFAARVGLVESS